MSTAAPAVDGFESFRANARFYAPSQVTRQLRSLACAPALALVVDVDALERSVMARVERVMALALDALAKTNVQVVLVAREHQERARQLHRVVQGARYVEHDDVVGHVRGELPNVPVIVISDAPRLLENLGESDRAIPLCDADLGVRATLWWLVDARARSTR
jgi:hypothetical protein